jgi:putative ABC transport system substrate-binding protein
MMRQEAALSAILALALIAAPLPSHGQQPGKIYRVGRIGNSVPFRSTLNLHNCPINNNITWEAWVEGMQACGFVEGRNLVTECRYTEGRLERAPALAAELLRFQPDLLLVAGTANVLAVQQANRTIPILMHGVVTSRG